MIDKSLLPEGIEVSAEDLAKTPPSVLKLLMYLLEENLLAVGDDQSCCRLLYDTYQSV